MLYRTFTEAASVRFGLGSWNTRDDEFDVWIRKGGKTESQRWRWLSPFDRPETARVLARYRKLNDFLSELAKHAERLDARRAATPIIITADGPRCPSCGTRLDGGPAVCPSCDERIDYSSSLDYSCDK